VPIAVVSAVLSVMALSSPVLAHGGDDAQAVARNLPAGPYNISLWQVDAPSGATYAPHVIVMFDGGAPAPMSGVVVYANGSAMDTYRSTTTPNSWETTQGVVEGEALSVSISDGVTVRQVGPVVVPAPPTSMLPMREVVLAFILLTAATLWWMAARAARGRRRPAPKPIACVTTNLSEG
jgi:hypothetical protein